MLQDLSELIAQTTVVVVNLLIQGVMLPLQSPNFGLEPVDPLFLDGSRGADSGGRCRRGSSLCFAGFAFAFAFSKLLVRGFLGNQDLIDCIVDLHGESEGGGEVLEGNYP